MPQTKLAQSFKTVGKRWSSISTSFSKVLFRRKKFKKDQLILNLYNQHKLESKISFIDKTK